MAEDIDLARLETFLYMVQVKLRAYFKEQYYLFKENVSCIFICEPVIPILLCKIVDIFIEVCVLVLGVVSCYWIKSIL